MHGRSIVGNAPADIHPARIINVSKLRFVSIVFPFSFFLFFACVHESFFGYLSSFIFVKLEKEKHFIIIFIRLTAVDSERGMLRNDFFRSV
jgi:hypothetical protein